MEDAPLVSEYLNTKRQKLLDELTRLQNDADLTQTVRTEFPRAEQHLKAINAWYKDACDRQQEVLVKENEQAAQATPPSLDVLNDGKSGWVYSKQGAYSVMGGLFVLSLILGWGLSLLISWGAIIASGGVWAGMFFVYKSYVDRAKTLVAAKASAPPVKLLKSIKKLEFILMQFAPRKEGDFSKSYHCTQITPGKPKEIMQIWELNHEKYGELYGASFLGVVDPKEDYNVTVLLRLPEGEQKLQSIELRQGSMNALRYIKNAFLEYVAKEAPRIIEELTPLTQSIERYHGKSQRVQAVNMKIKELDAQEESFQQVGVEVKTLDEILLNIDMFQNGGPTAPRGILLHGPSGTGKSQIGLAIATSTRCGFLKADLADLRNGEPGAVAEKVKKLWRWAFLRAPCILFVDDCDNVFDNRVDAYDAKSPERAFINSFLKEWDAMAETPAKVIVLGATNRREVIDLSILLRFNQLVEMALPTPPVRKRILVQEFKQAGLLAPVTELMCKETAGMAWREMHQLTLRLKGVALGNELTPQVFTEVIKSVRSKASTLTENVGWDDVILPSETKQKLQYLAKKIKQSEEYSKMGLPVSKSLLLYGPPGTGKTQIVRALATESGLSFMAASTSEIKGTKAGESGKYVRALFEKARSQAPCLLFIDEIDIVTSTRRTGDQIGQEIVGQFLQEMDGINSRVGMGQVFVIGATNNRDEIDEAVLSRFNEQEAIGLPDAECRAAIIRLNLAKKPTDFNLKAVSFRLAQATEGFSGRDILTMVNAAASKAMLRADQMKLDIKDIKISESDFEGLIIGDKFVTLE